MDRYSGESFDQDENDAAAWQREVPRDSLFLLATLKIDGRPDVANVRVRNLSAGGLMAEYAQSVEVGTAICVELRGVGAVHGHVAWVAEGRVGVAFTRPINPILARKPVGAAPEPKRTQRPL